MYCLLCGSHYAGVDFLSRRRREQQSLEFLLECEVFIGHNVDLRLRPCQYAIKESSRLAESMEHGADSR